MDVVHCNLSENTGTDMARRCEDVAWCGLIKFTNDLVPPKGEVRKLKEAPTFSVFTR